MWTRVIEVDEDVFQVYTQFEDGTATVELFVGYDAYARHLKTETQHATERGHLPEESYSLSMWNREPHRWSYRPSRDW